MKLRKRSTTFKNKVYYLKLLRELRIREARENFYDFCCLIHPELYKSKSHLKELCGVLQKLVQGKLKKKINGKFKTYKNIIIEIPPRHGKTRTLTLLSAWLLGVNPKYKIIATSYNDTLAQKFSKYTRNTIQEESTTVYPLYPDIFPDTKIKQGDASVQHWAVEGSFFSYKGAGVGGTITGQGADLIIVDDPIKSAEEAFNENLLEKKWEWYTGTLLSRQEKGCIKIICHTPWASQDIGGRLNQDENYYVYRRPAWNGKKMLCDDILNKEEYDLLKRDMLETIFTANYDCTRIDVKGLLYSNLKIYEELPKDANNRILVENRAVFGDIADRGNDYLCLVFGVIWNNYFYVTDVYFTQEDVDITEEEAAFRIIDQKIDLARIEANNAGHAWARHVEKILGEKYNWYGTIFDSFTQTGNKESRMLTMAGQVKERILFPADWRHRWPDFYDQVTTFKKKGKNLHDDAPDTLTQIAEYLCNGSGVGSAFTKGLY